MPTINPRLNVTLSPETAGLLTQLAKREGKSVASLAKDLILDALEQREDLALSMLAELREKEQASKKTISHADAWR